MAAGTVETKPAGTASCPLPSPRPAINLVEPKKKRPAKSAKAVRSMRSIFRFFSMLPTPSACRFHGHHIPCGARQQPAASNSLIISRATRTTVTLFGHRRSRCITLAIQESPRGVPILVLELNMPTSQFMKEMAADHLRVALECRKNAGNGGRAKKMLLDEQSWEAYVNGRTAGCAVRREPSESDLVVIQMLYRVSMGAGVLPDDTADAADGEITYMRAHFDRVVGHKDSETFYMLNPDGSYGPELTIFFIRV